MKLTLATALVLLIIFQSNVFTFYLITHPKGKKVSNLILGGLTLCLGLHFTNILVTNLPNFWMFPQLNPVFGLLYAPLFYFYAQSLIYKSIDLKRLRFKWHVLANLPLFAYAVYWIAGDYYKRVHKLPLDSVVTVPVLLQISVYLVLSYLAILRYQRVLSNTQSSVDKINLSWLKYINTIMAIFVLTTSIEFLGISLFQPFIVELIFAVILLLVVSFVYKGLKHPEFFAGIVAEDEAAAFETKVVLSNARETTRRDLEHLQQYMLSQKPYLEPNLNLQQLAKAVNLAPRYLSQLINQQLKQNFFEFINTYRIEEAKALLGNPANQRNRINEVMFDVGFSSKSTFNHVFKKVTGVTPSQFKKNNT